MSEAVIQVKDFRKTYGDFVAVDGISFEVNRGEIFGLLGPNGAGKTSTLEMPGRPAPARRRHPAHPGRRPRPPAAPADAT